MRKTAATFVTFLLSLYCLCGVTSSLEAAQFNVEEMPIGAEITIPGTATTMASVTTSMKVAATDAPQTVSIVPVGIGGGSSPIKLSIYDGKQERVKYVDVHPGSPFLYSFKGLAAITVRAEVSKDAALRTSIPKLKIESDKPLTFTRVDSLKKPSETRNASIAQPVKAGL